MDNKDYAGLGSAVLGERWSVRGLFRVASIIMVTPPFAAVQLVILGLIPRFWWPTVGLWHRLMCHLLGIRIRTGEGGQHTGPVLYVCNHISWVDILVLGGQLKRARFVAKAEVSKWGVLGKLSKLHKTVFIDRKRKRDSAKQRDMLTNHIQEGDSLILFPEGTSTRGVHVASFKTSLFSVAEAVEQKAGGTPLRIQPVTIAYTAVNGMPLVRSQKPWIAWLGDMELVSHLRQLTARSRIEATIEFHDPVTLDAFADRKTLAAHCEERVRNGLEKAHRIEYVMGPRKQIIKPSLDEATVHEIGETASLSKISGG